MEEQKCLAAYKPTKVRAIFGSGMRAFFAILSLLLCPFETRADELPVIKDSEAIHCVGKNVEVHMERDESLQKQIKATFRAYRSIPSNTASIR